MLPRFHRFVQEARSQRDVFFGFSLIGRPLSERSMRSVGNVHSSDAKVTNYVADESAMTDRILNGLYL